MLTQDSGPPEGTVEEKVVDRDCDPGAPPRPQDVLLTGGGAARLHGLHSDDAGRGVPGLGILVRGPSLGDPGRVVDPGRLRRDDGLCRCQDRSDHRGDGPVQLREPRLEARLAAARWHPDRLVRRDHRDHRRPDRIRLRDRVVCGQGDHHGGHQHADVHHGALRLPRHVLGLGDLHAADPDPRLLGRGAITAGGRWARRAAGGRTGIGFPAQRRRRARRCRSGCY